jgi:4-hydroxy-tetrahydrodipicolinate reductase
MAGLAVFGITGRMGQSVLRALREIAAPRFALCGALASASSARLGHDAAAEGPPTGVRVTADAGEALAGAAVALEFSVPQRIAEHARLCRDLEVPLLVGATGFDRETRAVLEAAAGRVAVLIAPNTSVGVAVLDRLVALAAAALKEGYDVEVSEAHHRMKRDAPSGTALALGETVARANGKALADLAVYERRAAAEPRAPGSIGFAVMRAGDIVGEHTVTFAAAGERIELTHRATDRLIFARGALRAAEWLIGRPPGLYGMADVLGLGPVS